MVGKDELIGMLLSELKVSVYLFANIFSKKKKIPSFQLKRTALATCMAEKKVVGKFEGQIMWEEMNEKQKNAILRAQVCLRIKMMKIKIQPPLGSSRHLAFFFFLKKSKVQNLSPIKKKWTYYHYPIP